jgi:hypothetical protein
VRARPESTILPTGVIFGALPRPPSREGGAGEGISASIPNRGGIRQWRCTCIGVKIGEGDVAVPILVRRGLEQAIDQMLGEVALVPFSTVASLASCVPRQLVKT